MDNSIIWKYSYKRIIEKFTLKMVYDILLHSIRVLKYGNMANILPPNSVGYVHNPNLVLPIYIQTEVIRVQDQNGVVWNVRRPRPLSILSGAQLVLQCDRELLARYLSFKKPVCTFRIDFILVMRWDSIY
jgi:hypothetical protein